MPAKRSVLWTLFAISLLAAVISPPMLFAVTAPEIKSLGQLQSGLYGVSKLDFDSAGNLYLVDPRRQLVVKIDKYGDRVASFPAPATGAGLAVTEDGSRIFVSGKDFVSILDGEKGRVLGSLGGGIGEFEAAGDLALDGQGFVFAADSRALTVKVYDLDGNFRYRFGGPGKGFGQFQSIWDMTVNPFAREVYVADVITVADVLDPATGAVLERGSKPKVQIFSLGGEYLRSLSAQTGFGEPGLTFFKGVEFDDKGRAFVLDSLRGEIRALSLPGTFLARYSEEGYREGQLMRPSDSAFDPVTKRLFVLCQSGRVEIFGVDGGVNPVKLNARPGRPVPLSPVGGAEVTSGSVELLFRNAVDSDSSPLKYDLQLHAAGEVVSTFAEIPEGRINTSVLTDVRLVENAAYRWEVQASDGVSASGWTAPAFFYVNAQEEPPVAPVLLSPVENELSTGEGLLLWQESTDPDPNDVVSYQLEIASGPDFVSPEISEMVEGAALPLLSLSNYRRLKDGAAYFWRLTAVDNHGLRSEPSNVGSFLYDTSILKISSDISGVKVYSGGNHGHPGVLLGEAPLELRDLGPEPLTLVAERAGFEPVVQTVFLGEFENRSLHLSLLPALLPEDPVAELVFADERPLEVIGGASPFVVDFDNDSYPDLLVGDAAGWIYLCRGTESGSFEAPEMIELPAIPGASPFVADWNRDGRKDLIVGGLDGTVVLYLNLGRDASPVFAEGRYLSEAGSPVDVGDRAVPVFVNEFEDLGPGLLVGSKTGRLYFYGLDPRETDVAVLSPGVKVLELDVPVTPVAADWDADGARDLLVSGGGELRRFRRVEGEMRMIGTIELPGQALRGGGELKPFVLDADGAGGKDLYLGDGIGRVWLLSMQGKTHLPAFVQAIGEKREELAEAALKAGVEIGQAQARISQLLNEGRFSEAWASSLEVGAFLTPEPDLVVQAQE